MNQKSRFLLVVLSLSVLLNGVGVRGDGVYDESVVREFYNYMDRYYFSASAYSWWTILTSSVSGGSGGIWDSDVYSPGSGGNSASAQGDRRSGVGSAQMFGARLYGSIRPLGGNGSPRSYSYSVSARFNGSLLLKPSQRTVPMYGGGN